MFQIYRPFIVRTNCHKTYKFYKYMTSKVSRYLIHFLELGLNEWKTDAEISKLGLRRFEVHP